MATVTFDGVNKLMIVQTAPVGGVVTLDVQRDLYSAWKNWLADNIENAKYLPAFTPIGGDDIGGGEAVGLTFLVKNGWRIRPYELSHTLKVTGNIIGEGGAEIVAPTIGGYTVSTQIRWASLAQAIDTADSSGLLASIYKILANKQILDPTTGKLTVFDDDSATTYLQADVYEDANGTQKYRGGGAERREKLT